MRILNGAQTTLAYLGVLAGHEHTFDAIGDPLLETFVRRMLIEESVPTLRPVPGMPALPYVEQSLSRLHNTAIRHRCHQIATDGSQKIVQRLLNPIRERLRRGERITLLTLPVAAWMAYLIFASDRFGRRVGRPTIRRQIASHRSPIASAMIQKRWRPKSLPSTRSSTVNSPVIRPSAIGVTQALAAMLSADPMAYLHESSEFNWSDQLKPAAQTA